MRRTIAVIIGAAAAVFGSGGTAFANGQPMPNVPTMIKQWSQPLGDNPTADAAYAPLGPGITPPAPPCPQNGLLPSVTLPVVGSVGINCSIIPETPATGLPFLGNMAYYGGKVQVHPKLYLVYWGWGQTGAFTKKCTFTWVTEGQFKFRLPCDPDGAGKHMADFVQQLGGTTWDQVQSQYYETVNGKSDYIVNDKNQLAGVWIDNGNLTDLQAFTKSNLTNPVGPTNTQWALGKVAAAAADHFGLRGAALTDADFIVLQPQGFSDPAAQAAGYCAWHDWTGYGAYKGITLSDGKSVIDEPFSFTNYPYVLNQGANCGANSVNAGAAGALDGTTIALGHEIEETATDPGAETQVGSLLSTVAYGGWYDPFDGNENGDKCAWVGTTAGILPTVPMPGAVSNTQGNDSGTFAIQSLWSNSSNAGTGYCAGSQYESPLPVLFGSTYGAPDAPVNQTAPSIKGAAGVGSVLAAKAGTYSNAPSAYAYQWLLCDATGANCTAINGANRSWYTVPATAVGKTLEVETYAANAYGSSPTWTASAPTAVG